MTTAATSTTGTSTPRPALTSTTVVVVGAGLSGICLGHDLLAAGIDDFVILEAADGVGGTWRHNTYPGAACDVPSHLYCFSFAPNPDWSRVYSPQAEILGYVEQCVQDFGLASHLQFGATVLAHRFDDQTGRWSTDLQDGRTIESKFVVRASGGLHKPLWPTIPGLEDFTGTLMHSARWQPEMDLAGKTVAIIGSAASAIQITPKVAAAAAAMTLYQRTPNYIFPREDRDYTEAEQAQFRTAPEDLAALREQIFMRCEVEVFPIIAGAEEVQQFVRAGHRDFVASQILDEELRAKLIPDYPVGCKRMLSSDEFYPTLNQAHVDFRDTAIERLDATGIQTVDGEHRAYDVVICATGFDLAGHRNSVEVTGQHGQSLTEFWAQDTAAYRGVGIPGFPNLFLVIGPNTGTGTLSTVHAIEVDCNYIVRCIALAMDDQLLQPTMASFTEYNDKLQARLQKTVWAGSCDSWYKVNGRITSLYPGDGREYAADKAELLLDELDIQPIGAAALVTAAALV